MKQKFSKKSHQSGFTIIELLVVLSIMAIIATVIVLDFSRQRAVRSVVLAKNETITSLRKIQSYMLSSKNISDGVPAKFYIAKFEMPQSGTLPNSFTLQAVDSQLTLHDNLETITLPAGVQFTSFNIEPVTKDAPVPYSCVQVVFSAPFGSMYANGSSSCDSSIAQTLGDPVAVAGLAQRKTYIHFGVGGADNGYILINPATGQMSAN